ncbi:hypothetical protein HMPREF3208_01359, partial [Gardnerella vaginalis]
QTRENHLAFGEFEVAQHSKHALRVENTVCLTLAQHFDRA